MIDTQIAPFVCFAARRKNGEFNHIYPTEFQVKMCTSDTIYRLEMSPSADGEYWGWLVDGSVSLIQSSMVTFEMCFPGGLAAAEATGRGVRIQLDVSSWLPEGCW